MKHIKKYYFVTSINPFIIEKQNMFPLKKAKSMEIYHRNIKF